MAEIATIQVQVDASQAKTASKNLRDLGYQAKVTGTHVEGAGGKAEKAGRKMKTLSGIVSRARIAFGALGIGIGGLSLGALAGEVQRATSQLNNMDATLRVATGSTAKAADSMRFLREESERLGLFLPAVAKQYGQFAAAAKSADITTQELRDTFTGVAEASRAMGLTIPETEGAMKALQQMMSKGKISAEELRQQLGERLPGSIQIMAQSLDISTSKLFDMMENGELLSDEVLPKFGRELQRVFGGEATQQANKMAASIARLKTAFFDLMAQEGGLPSAAQGINDLASALNSDDFKQGFDLIVEGFGKSLALFARNLDVIAKLAGAAGIAGLTFAFKALIGILTATIGSLSALTARAAGATGAVRGLAVATGALSKSLSAIAWPLAAAAAAASAYKIYTSATNDAADATKNWNERLNEVGGSLQDKSGFFLRTQMNQAREDIEQLDYIEGRIENFRKILRGDTMTPGFLIDEEEIQSNISTLQDMAKNLKGADDALKRLEIADSLRKLRNSYEDPRGPGGPIVSSEDLEAINSLEEELTGLNVKQEEAARLARLYAGDLSSQKDAFLELLEATENVRQNDLVPPDARGGLSIQAQQDRIDVINDRRDAEAEAAEEAERQLQEQISKHKELIGLLGQYDESGIVQYSQTINDLATLLDAGYISQKKFNDELQRQKNILNNVPEIKAYKDQLTDLGVSQDQASQFADIYGDRLKEDAEKAEQMREDFVAAMKSAGEGNPNDLLPPAMREMTSDAQLERIDIMAEKLREAKEEQNELNMAFKNGLSDAMTDALMGVEKLSDGLKNLADQIRAMVLQKAIADPIAQGITDFATGFDFGAGSGANPQNSTHPRVSGDRANGGNVYGDKMHLVGERGPEMFVPGQDGQIIPNHQMGGGGDVTVNIINQGGEQLQSEKQSQRRGPNGEQTVDVMVKSSIERLDGSGQLDGVFKRHGARRQGQF